MLVLYQKKSNLLVTNKTSKIKIRRSNDYQPLVPAVKAKGHLFTGIWKLLSTIVFCEMSQYFHLKYLYFLMRKTVKHFSLFTFLGTEFVHSNFGPVYPVYRHLWFCTCTPMHSCLQLFLIVEVSCISEVPILCSPCISEYDGPNGPNHTQTFYDLAT